MYSRRKRRNTAELMANLAAGLGNAKGAKEQMEKYLNLIWHEDIVGNRTQDMLEEYSRYKQLTPELYSFNGQATVRGLDI